MLGYAKQFKDKLLAQGRAEGRAEGKAEGKAEGRAEVYRELQEAQEKGITLEELLKTHDPENGKNAGEALSFRERITPPSFRIELCQRELG